MMTIYLCVLITFYTNFKKYFQCYYIVCLIYFIIYLKDFIIYLKNFIIYLKNFIMYLNYIFIYLNNLLIFLNNINISFLKFSLIKILFNQEETALHIACEKGHSEIVELLISQKNLDINLFKEIYSKN